MEVRNQNLKASRLQIFFTGSLVKISMLLEFITFRNLGRKRRYSSSVPSHPPTLSLSSEPAHDLISFVHESFSKRFPSSIGSCKSNTLVK